MYLVVWLSHAVQIARNLQVHEIMRARALWSEIHAYAEHTSSDISFPRAGVSTLLAYAFLQNFTMGPAPRHSIPF